MKNITILIKPASSLCNMRCVYCFYSDIAAHRQTESYGIMTRDVLRALTERAFECATESVSFVFQGGEPTLAGLDFYKSAIAYQREYNKRTIAVYNFIQTNGVLLNEEWVKFFKENRFLVGLSIDGYEALHDSQRRMKSGEGSYSHAKAAAELMRAAGVAFNILAVVTKNTVKDPRGVYNALSEYGYLQFIPLIPTDICGGEYAPCPLEYGKFLTEIFDEYKRDINSARYVSIRDFDSYVGMMLGMPPSSCALAGRCGGYFTVEADGGVYPCDFYVTDEYLMGNILENTFEEIAATDTAAQFIRSSLKASDKCEECHYFALCRGGCRRLREPGAARFIYCEGYKFFFEHCKEGIAELARLIAERKRGANVKA